MGRFVIVPPPPGLVCPICWGQGKSFGASPTPSVVTVIFSGIEKTPNWLPGDGEPPNGSYTLGQDGPCLFSFRGDDVSADWRLRSIDSLLVMELSGQGAFLHNISEVCQRNFVNQLNPAFFKFAGGEAEIFI